MESRKIKCTYSRVWRKASGRSLRPTLGQNKGIRGGEFPVEESSPFHSQHEKAIAIHMVDMPVIQTSPSPEASSRRILHALTPPLFDYTQYMESPLDEPKPFNTQDDYNILPRSTSPFMRPGFSQWNSNGPEYDTPQHKYRFSDVEGCKKIEKDCQSGNLPANVSNRAKYLWKILSQAAADYNSLRLDETMDKLPAVLVACCIYIACQQCKIPRTFIAIRVFTETSSL
ncbi:hypothetical protein BCIN_01g07160 [Botrytis cinerea B05.10]|uniref:Transcription factor TFIIB cyclin-like domain-containing protein n=1 Tax=Botryotinia fuckeliana (strain B05.10) TaxID=332648 RepID=A0A384J679_BOTFB|nr:hypothetical protein BCIN_01g07160 [Botrytis cinerea B05.10]ATZ46039.1 hypothetical protein BCIN_01g07160 [Botrytis cinerea B05.10]